jgi:hypothetical protein
VFVSIPSSLSSPLSIFYVISSFHGAGIAQWYSAGLGLNDWGVRFPVGAGNYSLQHRVQSCSEAHSASYAMGTRGSFPGGKAAGTWSWPLTSI